MIHRSRRPPYGLHNGSRRQRSRSGDLLAAADELSGLLETAHLLRSPENAERLLKALKHASRHTNKPQSLDKLRLEMGLAKPR
jgi:antitoxin YefM